VLLRNGVFGGQLSLNCEWGRSPAFMLILPRGLVDRIWNIDNFTEQCISYHEMARSVASV
jgi:hypothetical protein